MILSSQHQYLSIAPFNSNIQLPNLTILTGLNGTGKTQLLNGIANGQILVDNTRKSVVYFDYISFRVSGEQAITQSQVTQLRDQAWGYFNQAQPNIANQTFVNKLQQLYNQSQLASHMESASYDSQTPYCKMLLENPDPIIRQKLDVYVKSLEQFFTTEANRHTGNQQHASFSLAFSDMYRKSPKPIHLLDKEEFDQLYQPAYISTGAITNRLSQEFGAYIRKRAEYCYSEGDLSPNARKLEFEQGNIPPWKIVSEILQDFENFEHLVYTDKFLNIQEYANGQYSFPAPLVKVKNCSTPVSFESLSSGEKVLLSLAITIYQSNQKLALPDILLLDEIDATLHPSMISTLLETIQKVYSTKGCKVIFSTHSPTTVALAPPESIYTINKDPALIQQQGKIAHLKQQEAIKVLTQGFATLDDGLQFFSNIKPSELNIVSEGYNWIYLKKAVQLLAPDLVDQIHIMERAEEKTGSATLKSMFEFFTGIVDTSKLLIVGDADTMGTLGKKIDKHNVYVHVIPKNQHNKIAPQGIENALSEENLKTANVVFKQTEERDGITTEKIRFDGNKKRVLEQWLLTNGTVDDFQHFLPFITKIREILVDRSTIAKSVTISA